MTHIDNIIALGNKIVDNLNTMGVSASFNDGALTLADKILDIQTADYSNILLLYADAKIISKDEALELYALYLQDGLPVSNETITFTVKDANDTIVETLTGTTNTDGIANVSYLGKDTGGLNIQASINNGMLLSEIYEIEGWSTINLNGTETIKQISGSTTISNGEMYCGSAYLTDPEYSLNLQDDWILTCDIKWNGSYSASLCLVKQGTTARDTNRFMIQDKEYSCNANGKNKWISHPSLLSKNVYYSVTLTCLNGVLTAEINNNKTVITSSDWEILGTDCEMGIGVDTWGNCGYIKNIKFKIIKRKN